MLQLLMCVVQEKKISCRKVACKAIVLQRDRNFGKEIALLVCALLSLSDSTWWALACALGHQLCHEGWNMNPLRAAASPPLPHYNYPLVPGAEPWSQAMGAVQAQRHSAMSLCPSSSISSSARDSSDGRRGFSWVAMWSTARHKPVCLFYWMHFYPEKNTSFFSS